MILRWFFQIGTLFFNFFFSVGNLVVFIAKILTSGFIPPFYLKEVTTQLYKIGYTSLPVVGLTAFFTGGALALQIFEGGSRFNAESVVPSIVAIGMIRELGPVLGGLMVAGRVSAAMAAEIGTMKVTEQLDALTTLSTDPIKYLVFPRIIASIVSLPILVLVGNTIGVMGGLFVGVTRLNFNSNSYLLNTIEYLTFDDFLSSLIKATIFGFIIGVMGCYNGFFSNRGAEGVGRATTAAVVSSSILILASNYFLTELLFKP
ncbi:MAG: ABC transporter permease [Paracoccaceae bacterium]|nr:ABC transporter permease [Paracoccaceae bacterium]